MSKWKRYFSLNQIELLILRLISIAWLVKQAVSLLFSGK